MVRSQKCSDTRALTKPRSSTTRSASSSGPRGRTHGLISINRTLRQIEENSRRSGEPREKRTEAVPPEPPEPEAAFAARTAQAGPAGKERKGDGTMGNCVCVRVDDLGRVALRICVHCSEQPSPRDGCEVLASSQILLIDSLDLADTGGCFFTSRVVGNA